MLIEKQSVQITLYLVVGNMSLILYVDYTCYGSNEKISLPNSNELVDVPGDGLQTPQHPPKITHRPKGNWGKLKEMEGADKIST